MLYLKTKDIITPIMLSYSLCWLKSAHNWHVKIHDYKVKISCSGRIVSLKAVLSSLDIFLFYAKVCLENSGKDHKLHYFIIYDQNWEI